MFCYSYIHDGNGMYVLAYALNLYVVVAVMMMIMAVILLAVEELVSGT